LSEVETSGAFDFAQAPYFKFQKLQPELHCWLSEVETSGAFDFAQAPYFKFQKLQPEL
jgi:hypothetical protein